MSDLIPNRFGVSTTQQRSKWLSVLGAGWLLVAVLILLLTPTADGFEVSIYSAYPFLFWGLLAFVLLIGQVLIFRAAFSDSPNPGNWRIGFLLTLFVGAIVLFMPIFRGYPMYGRADMLTHLGHIRVIQETGGGPFQNVYQNIHQLVLALSYATGLEPLQVINAVAAIVSLLSIIASYVLLSAVFNRRRTLLTLPFMTVLISGHAHINTSPFAQSVLLVPFVLYLFVKTQQTESFGFRLPLTVAVVAVTLYHPLTAVFLLLIFIIHYAVIARSSSQVGWHGSAPASRVTASSVIQLTVVVFLAWYYNFVGIFIRVEKVVRRLLNPGGTQSAQLDAYSQTLTEYSPSLVDIGRVGLYLYGHRFLLVGIGSLFTVIAVLRYMRGYRFETPYLLTFLLAFTTFSALSVVFLGVDLIGGMGRPLAFSQLFAALTSGTLVAYLYDHINRQRVVTVGAVLLLLVLGTLSMLTLYHSPAGGQSNHQVTQGDIDGAEWYLENDLQSEPIQEIGTKMYRFEHMLLGTDSNAMPKGGTAPPERFNYTTHQTLGESYNATHYLVVTERGKQFYPTTYPDYEEYWRFKPKDFSRLSNDSTVSHVYANDDFDVYIIQPTDDS